MFETIQGKYEEPLAAGALACLLNLDAVRETLIGCIPEAPGLNAKFRVERESHGQGVRPDIGLISDEAAIALEVKFEARLTEAQRSGYAEWFKNKRQAFQKVVFLLPKAIDYRIDIH